jgi:pyruvate dehydrogenase E1 component
LAADPPQSPSRLAFIDSLRGLAALYVLVYHLVLVPNPDLAMPGWIRPIIMNGGSGVTLGPEGGAHQSINTPLVGMGQPGLERFEPAYADEVALMMRSAFDNMQADDGSSVYLRLTTRQIEQQARADHAWEAGALAGAYWLREPAPGAKAAIAFCGAVAPEALGAWVALQDDIPGLGLLAVTSPDRLHREWSQARAARWQKGAGNGVARTVSHIESLLGQLAPGAGLVTVLDGSPAALSWLGGVKGQRVSPLGTDRFGQTGDLIDLYRSYRVDAEAIIDAAAELFLN